MRNGQIKSTGGQVGAGGRWLGVLTLYDLLFVLVSVGVFDYLLED